jgi:signal transduction histidine kinase
MMNELNTTARFPATILIVDDNTLNVQLISTLLRSKGYKPVVANSGANALKYLEQKLPDLILLDIMMPEMDGFEVCQIIKSQDRFSDIPLIFLTAKNEVADVVKGFSLGAVDFISKPFRSEEVLIRIQNHLALKQAQFKLEEQNRTLQSLNKKIESSNQQLAKQASDLKELNAQKNRFFSILAHDLRNPFSGFIGMTNLLRHSWKTMQEDELEDFIVTLDDTADKVNKLLENLLKWSQVQLDSLVFEKSCFNLKNLVDDVIALKKTNADKKKLNLINKIDPKVQLFADEQMTQMVVRNLISNAIKFTPKEGLIKIEAVNTKKDMLQVAVCDNGIGMSADTQKKLFNISEKVSRPGTEGEESTGLGLILCKALIEKQGGKLWVESEEGSGSVFYFTLPVSE